MILGVDPQPSGATACLCEGPAPIWPPPAIHDGGPSGAVQGATPVWTSLHAQLVRFLGDKELVRNVQIAVIEQPEEVLSWGRSEGFGAAKVVCAGRAALVAATQELDWDPGRVPQLRLVVVNETWVGIYAYRLSELGVVSHAATPIRIGDTGSAFWVSEVAGTITARISEDLAGQADLGNLPAAAAEIGLRLTDAPTDDFAVAWKGMQIAKMSSVPVFTRRLSARWTSVRRLADELPRALAKVAEIFDGPSPILLAGVGAGWPFAAQIASAQGAVHTVADPAQALARGAAWWPERGEALFAGIADGVVAQAARETAVPNPERRGGVDLERLARLAGRSEHKP